MGIRIISIPVGIGIMFAVTACDAASHDPESRAVLLTHDRPRECSDPSFRKNENYKPISMESEDPAVKSAKSHAGRIMDLSHDFCILEKTDTKFPERCFLFFDRIPTPGGGGLICTRNARTISHVYLEERSPDDALFR